MKKFLGDDFLLSNETAVMLYSDFAKDLPIIDYHCHVSPEDIYRDKHFENLYDVWLSGDHYKWRIMRSNGVDERYITGDAPDKEKFLRFAETLPKAIGNPMYHWCHLELKNYFGFEGTLNTDTAEQVWELANAKLKEEKMGARGIIEKSGVCFVGTTDDPADSLEWHIKLREDKDFSCTVAPTFRPDKAVNIDKCGWREYIDVLSKAADIKINSVETLKRALKSRIEFFDSCGCKASDHGLDYMVYTKYPSGKIEKIMKKALSGKVITTEEAEAFKTDIVLFCAREYARLGWVMQLHYNCLRNTNSKMFKALGADTGFDCIGPNCAGGKLTGLLDDLDSTSQLPKTIIYSLDSNDNEFIDTVIGAFQGTEVSGKIQHGSAWWFNDNKSGMQEQLTSLANLSLLGNFIGMLTDSRSFLSYTRHEYFRRILCDLIGTWVENGEYPDDKQQLGKIIEGICYRNAFRYFDLEEK